MLDSSFADPEGVYSQRIRAQPQLYGLVQRRIGGLAHLLAPLTEAELAAEAAERRRRGKRGARKAGGAPASAMPSATGMNPR